MEIHNYTLTMVFLHEEFISAMKTGQNPTGFHGKRKNNRKSFIFVSCLRFFTETLEQIVTKSHQILILDGKEEK